ncbi:MAG: hypothetical protein U1F81_19355 [Verrucomicrobiaceae bacterium]
MHFFISGISFYSFRNVFGYLLSQALFARFKAEGASFLPRCTEASTSLAARPAKGRGGSALRQISPAPIPTGPRLSKPWSLRW